MPRHRSYADCRQVERRMRCTLAASRKSARIAEDKLAHIFYESFLTCEKEHGRKKLRDPHLSRYGN